MLNINDKRVSIAALLMCLLFVSPQILASGATSSVFRFQQVMADKGLAQAQYKLAMMYESGTGVEASLIKAKIWYGRAALQNYKPAQHRLTYMDLKQNGYQTHHAAWIDDLKRDAVYGDGEALFLLGQMYADGTGVQQDLEKSRGLLKKASAGNVAGSETELLRVEGLYLAQQQRRQQEAEKQQAARKAQDLEQQKLQKQRQQRREQQRIAREKQLIVERQRQLEMIRKREVEQARIERELAKARARELIREAEQQAAGLLISETDTSSICSGRNRFSSTCR